MSVSTEHESPAAAARRHRVREELAHRDYLRSLLDASSGMAQRELAEVLRVSQAAVSKSLRSARAVPTVPDGFSGAGPYEIVQRYAAGEITRARLVDELTRWEYAPAPRGDVYDDVVVAQAGSFDEVRRGLSNGLIDAETYDAILEARAGRSSAA